MPRRRRPDSFGEGRPFGRYYSDRMTPRVVISGIGVVSTFGVGRECFWHNVSLGISGTRAVTEFDVSSFPCQVAAPVPAISFACAPRVDGDDEHDHDSRADPRRYSRAALL